MLGPCTRLRVPESRSALPCQSVVEKTPRSPCSTQDRPPVSFFSRKPFSRVGCADGGGGRRQAVGEVGSHGHSCARRRHPSCDSRMVSCVPGCSPSGGTSRGSIFSSGCSRYRRAGSDCGDHVRPANRRVVAGGDAWRGVGGSGESGGSICWSIDTRGSRCGRVRATCSGSGAHAFAASRIVARCKAGRVSGPGDTLGSDGVFPACANGCPHSCVPDPSEALGPNWVWPVGANGGSCNARTHSLGHHY